MPSKVVGSRTCLGCGVDFNYTTSTPNKRYCGVVCGKTRRSEDLDRAKTCPTCLVEFKYSASNAHKKFCSYACKSRKVVCIRSCGFCHTDMNIITRSPNKKYCNKTCHDEYMRAISCSEVFQCYMCGEDTRMINMSHMKDSPSGLFFCGHKCTAAWVHNRDRVPTDVIALTRAQKRRDYAREYESMKMSTDPKYKVKSRLRIRLNHALKTALARKTMSAVCGLGIVAEDFIKKIESQWLDGMSWNNYGSGINKWSLDHIIPFGKLDMNEKSHQEIAVHHANIQPMWSRDNIVKGDKFYMGRKGLLV